MENNNIDFNTIFKNLIKKNKENLIQCKNERVHENIMLFLEDLNGFELDKEDCVYSDSEIHFSFLKSSENVDESEKVYIIFNRIRDEFSSFEHVNW